MNILLLNGGPGDARGAACRRIKGAVEDAARSKGWAVKTFDLDLMDIGPCRGCFACWLKHPGICAVKDEQEAVLRAMAASDIQVWITTVTFGGYGSALKKALDRAIPNILPFFTRVEGEVHHPLRYEKRCGFLVAGSLSEPDEEAERIFHHLVRRNTLNLGGVATESAVFLEETEESSISSRVRALLGAIEESL